MKTLVAFYSLDGNTKMIAEALAQAAEADLLELKLKRPFKAKGFFKYFFGGFAAIRKTTPELLPLDRNPQDYDLVVLGTPVWASRFAPAMRTFLTRQGFKGKKVALFCCSGGGGQGQAFEEMRSLLEGNEVVSELALVQPLDKDREQQVQGAKDWIKSLI